MIFLSKPSKFVPSGWGYASAPVKKKEETKAPVASKSESS